MKKNKLILLLLFVLFSGYQSLIAQAALPTYCTDFTAIPAGWTSSASGTQPTHDNCNGPAARLNGAGQMITIHYSTAATNVSYSMSDQGAGTRTVLVQQSPDGISWTTVQTWTDVTAPILQTIYTHPLNATSRYVRFNMTARTGGRMEFDIVNIYNTTPSAIGGACDLNPYDCLNALPLCNDATFTGNSNDFGFQELNASNQGCLANENETFWYYWQPSTSGNMEFAITPTSGSVDYDFAIWQTTDCSNLGTPVRCSWSALTTITGLDNGAGDNSEGSGGDAWVEDIFMTAGQTYIMVIDNWTGNTTPFTIDFTLTNGLTLDCTPTPLPITLVEFNGNYDEKFRQNKLEWTTLTEINNNYFALEYSENAYDWKLVANIPGQGNSNEQTLYHYFHESPFQTTYYRLTQVDFDGQEKTYSPIVITSSGLELLNLTLYPNPTAGDLTINGTYKGEVEIIITDLMGKQMDHMVLMLEMEPVKLNLDHLKKGIYNVELKTPVKSEYHKIVLN